MKVFTCKIHLREEEFVRHQTGRRGGPSTAQGIHIQDKGVVTSQGPVSMVCFHLRRQKVCTPSNTSGLSVRTFTPTREFKDAVAEGIKREERTKKQASERWALNCLSSCS